MIDLLQLCWLLLWVPAVITVHEAGHALATGPAGYKLTSFGIGRGRPLMRHRGRRGEVYYLGRWLLAGGACVAVPLTLARGPRAALYHAGGALAQVALAVVLLLLGGRWWWVEPVARFNQLVLLWNLIPWRIGGLTSDGWRLLETLGRGRILEQPIYASRATLWRMLGFEQTVHSPVGTWYCLLLLAWADVMVGQTEGRFFEEEHPVSVLHPALDALQQYVVAQWHRAEGRPAEAQRVIARARQAWEGALPLGSADLLSLAEARVCLDLGDSASASRALSQVAGVEGHVGDEARVIALQIALCERDVPRIAQVAAGLPLRGLIDPVTAVEALWAAADALEDAGLEADGIRDDARQRLARLLTMAEPADAIHLRRRLAGSTQRGSAGG